MIWSFDLGICSVKSGWDKKESLALHGWRDSVYYQDRQLDTPYCTSFHVHDCVIAFAWHSNAVLGKYTVMQMKCNTSFY